MIPSYRAKSADGGQVSAEAQNGLTWKNKASDLAALRRAATTAALSTAPKYRTSLYSV